MTTIDLTTRTTMTLEVSFSSSTDRALAANVACLLPEPVGDAMGGGGIAEALARLVLQSTASQRASSRASEVAEERAANAAEDRQVAEMRQKASGMRTAAWVEGGIGITGGLVTIGSLGACKASDQVGLRQFGEQLSGGSKIASGLGGAAQAAHDATIEEQRGFAQRALRAGDDGKRAVQDAMDLANKALAFLRDAARTQADCNLTSVRWG